MQGSSIAVTASCYVFFFQKAVYHLGEPEEPHPTPRVILLLHIIIIIDKVRADHMMQGSSIAVTASYLCYYKKLYNIIPNSPDEPHPTPYMKREHCYTIIDHVVVVRADHMAAPEYLFFILLAVSQSPIRSTRQFPLFILKCHEGGGAQFLNVAVYQGKLIVFSFSLWQTESDFVISQGVII